MVSSKIGDAVIKVNQDVNIFSLYLEGEKTIKFDVKENRQAYLLLIEGKASIESIVLEARDALEIVEEEILIESKKDSHILVIEMNKGQ